MQPIDYDFYMSLAAIMLGLYALFPRLKAHTRKHYTAPLAAFAVMLGILYWVALAAASYATIYHEPSWLYARDWTGSWGYTIARLLNTLAWVMALVCICRYAPKCKATNDFKL